jgi:hypothetical protein
LVKILERDPKPLEFYDGASRDRFSSKSNFMRIEAMRIVTLTAYLILNKAILLRMREQPLKNSEPLEALPLKHYELNYFLTLQTAECEIIIL